MAQHQSTKSNMLGQHVEGLPLSWQAVAGDLLAAAVPEDWANKQLGYDLAGQAVTAVSPSRVSLLGQLLAFPPERQPLDDEQLRAGLHRLTLAVGAADDDGTDAVRSAAAAALTLIACELTKLGCKLLSLTAN